MRFGSRAVFSTGKSDSHRFTAAATSGTQSIVARRVSSFRPPWLDTLTPSAPCATAVWARCTSDNPYVVFERGITYERRHDVQELTATFAISQPAVSPTPGRVERSAARDVAEGRSRTAISSYGNAVESRVRMVVWLPIECMVNLELDPL